MRRVPGLRRAVGALVAAATVTTGLAACSSGAAPASRLFTEVHMRSASDQPELLLEPHGEVRGLVVYMHGIDGSQDDMLDSHGLFPLRNALLGHGYAIVASDAHGNNAGNPVSLRDQLAAARDARARLDGIARVDIVAFSMGGLDALLTAASHKLPDLRAVALLSPVVDQTKFMTGPYASIIAAAFDDPSGDEVQKVIARSDPLAQPATDYLGYTYHFWQSPDDNTVPASQAATMSKYLATVGIDAPVTPLTGDHGDLSALDPSAVVSLFDDAPASPVASLPTTAAPATTPAPGTDLPASTNPAGDSSAAAPPMHEGDG